MKLKAKEQTASTVTENKRSHKMNFTIVQCLLLSAATSSLCMNCSTCENHCDESKIRKAAKMLFPEQLDFKDMAAAKHSIAPWTFKSDTNNTRYPEIIWTAVCSKPDQPKMYEITSVNYTIHVVYLEPCDNKYYKFFKSQLLVTVGCTHTKRRPMTHRIARAPKRGSNKKQF